MLNSVERVGDNIHTYICRYMLVYLMPMYECKWDVKEKRKGTKSEHILIYIYAYLDNFLVEPRMSTNPAIVLKCSFIVHTVSTSLFLSPFLSNSLTLSLFHYHTQHSLSFVFTVYRFYITTKGPFITIYIHKKV
jgi:hypothetical protein